MPAPAPATRTMSGVKEAARLADEAASGRVVISGSLPPDARDIDLVARADDAQRIAEALRSAGFQQHGGEWVRFHSCTAEAVDLIPATDWELPAEEIDRLFADAVPVDGYERLTRPAPADLLLMLARRLIGGDGRLDAKRRARVEAALLERPDAWSAAEAAAPRWGLALALHGLRDAYEHEAAVRRGARAAAHAERLVALGSSLRRARAEAWRRVLRPPAEPGGFLVAFSGLDGAGKSSQAEA